MKVLYYKLQNNDIKKITAKDQ